MLLNNTRGIDVLSSFAKEKVLWSPSKISTISWDSEPDLIKLVKSSHWNIQAYEILRSLGITVKREVGNFILAYGSSNPVAWIIEDCCILKALSLTTGAMGVITIGRGGCSLSESLKKIESSWAVLSGRKTSLLHTLFNPNQLYLPSRFAQLPNWENLKSVFEHVGFSAVIDIAHSCYQKVRENNGFWVDFVAIYRYVTLQLINYYFTDLKKTIVCTAFEDLAYKVDSLKIDKFIYEISCRMVDFRSPRILSFPCQDQKSPCNSWHFINSRGHQLDFQKLGMIRKSCRIKAIQNKTMGQLMSIGAGLSGTAWYYILGSLGYDGAFSFLARDYSQGDVYNKVLEKFFVDRTNKTYAIPYSSLYFYGENCAPDHFIDALALLEILLRNNNPRLIISKIIEAIPIPYMGKHQTHIVLSLNGDIKIKRNE